MNLSLYRVVGNLKRIALGDLAQGVDFFTADKDDNGIITLTPVTVVDAVSRRASLTGTTDTAADDDDDDAAPFPN